MCNDAHHAHFTIWLFNQPDEWSTYHIFCGMCYDGDDEDMVIAANKKVLDGSDADALMILPSRWKPPTTVRC